MKEELLTHNHSEDQVERRVKRLINIIKNPKVIRDKNGKEDKQAQLALQIWAIQRLRGIATPKAIDCLREVGISYETLVRIPDSGDKAKGFPPNSILERHFHPYPNGELGKALERYIPVELNGKPATEQAVNEALEKERSNYALYVVRSAIGSLNGKS